MRPLEVLIPLVPHPLFSLLWRESCVAAKFACFFDSPWRFESSRRLGPRIRPIQSEPAVSPAQLGVPNDHAPQVSETVCWFLKGYLYQVHLGFTPSIHLQKQRDDLA